MKFKYDALKKYPCANILTFVTSYSLQTVSLCLSSSKPLSWPCPHMGISSSLGPHVAQDKPRNQLLGAGLGHKKAKPRLDGRKPGGWEWPSAAGKQHGGGAQVAELKKGLLKTSARALHLPACMCPWPQCTGICRQQWMDTCLNQPREQYPPATS